MSGSETRRGLIILRRQNIGYLTQIWVTSFVVEMGLRKVKMGSNYGIKVFAIFHDRIEIYNPLI